MGKLVFRTWVKITDGEGGNSQARRYGGDELTLNNTITRVIEKIKMTEEIRGTSTPRTRTDIATTRESVALWVARSALASIDRPRREDREERKTLENTSMGIL
jgi:hypothetical protein